jgi:8-oxo-dGTP diphosphatase
MSTRGVQVVIFNEDANRVLLVKREDFRVWTLPGGRVEPGYSIRIDRLIGEYWRPQLPNGGSLVYGYIGHIVSGDSSKHDWESIAVEWFDVDDLPQRMIQFAREVLRDATANHDAPVKRTQRLPFWQSVIVKIGLALRNLRNRLLQR